MSLNSDQLNRAWIPIRSTCVSSFGGNLLPSSPDQMDQRVSKGRVITIDNPYLCRASSLPASSYVHLPPKKPRCTVTKVKYTLFLM